MKLSVQTDSYRSLEEAVDSTCDSIRFGSEFCEYKMPDLETLEKACELVYSRGKEFTYVTPRLSNRGLELVRKSLGLLDEREKMSVVANDFGTLNIIEQYQNLKPHLGRQLTRIPARSPWVDTYILEDGFLARRWYNKVFSSTSLNYPLTIDLFRSKGIRKADVDWIPRTFPSFEQLVKHGLSLCVHLHLVPVTLTRRCHTARFLGKKTPEECSLPCLDKTFHLRNELFNLELYLSGNTVFSLEQPSTELMEELEKIGVNEYVLTMNSITGIRKSQDIDDFSRSLEKT